MPLAKIARSGRVQLTRLTLHHLDWPAATAEAAAEPPIVLLHPNRTNARVWDYVVEHSTLPNRWLAPDQRGHGRSDYPESGYQLDDYVTDLVELLDALGVARAEPDAPAALSVANASEVRAVVWAIQTLLAEASAALGRFFSFGGISPDRTRSCTFTQVRKLAESPGVYFTLVRSRPPSLSTSLWQFEQ